MPNSNYLPLKSLIPFTYTPVDPKPYYPNLRNIQPPFLSFMRYTCCCGYVSLPEGQEREIDNADIRAKTTVRTVRRRRLWPWGQPPHCCHRPSGAAEGFPRCSRAGQGSLLCSTRTAALFLHLPSCYYPCSSTGTLCSPAVTGVSEQGRAEQRPLARTVRRTSPWLWGRPLVVGKAPALSII